jgi:C-terminal processing protease CtpA/Prc
VVEAFKRYLKNSSLIKFGDYWLNVSQSGKVNFTKTFLKDTNSHVPIAVLIGPKTNSSGEVAAAIFHGRPNCKTFGATTKGNLSCNQPFKIDNQRTLWLTTTLVTTYDKVLQIREDLEPNVFCVRPLQTAKTWLKEI